jgi:uncharacterized protein (TIGR02646 family)
MIHVESLPLPDNAQTKLDEYQSQVDAKPTYKEQVKKAKSSFKSKNKKSNKTFKAVKKTLDRMCSGARRCNYCEDSAADEVEHFYPKDLYPEYCFAWGNYLYSCGRCNGTHKNNRFKIFQEDTRDVNDITPPRKNRQYERPPSGDPLLIDPRNDNPLDYIKLNLKTLKYEEIADDGTEAFSRGEWTIECLGLNKREVLVKSRNEAFNNYMARLETYRAKQNNAPEEKLQRMINGIKTMAHPTVWQEMVRQHHEHDELKDLFEAVPEAIEW